MMKQALFAVLIFSVILICFSCRKKNSDAVADEPEATVVYDNYSGLKVGNYWIYERFKIDSNGVAVSQNIFDSCYVMMDTILNGRTFTKLYWPDAIWGYNYKYLRDSMHYILAERIIFSSLDFSTNFWDNYNILQPSNDTIYHLVSKMSDRDSSVTVPAGTFITSNFKATYYFYNSWIYFGNFGKVRALNTRYAKNIGIITETLQFYTHQPYYIERRLVRYNVQ